MLNKWEQKRLINTMIANNKQKMLEMYRENKVDFYIYVAQSSRLTYSQVEDNYIMVIQYIHKYGFVPQS